MRGGGPDVKGTPCADVAENLLSCSGADNGPGLVMEDDRSVALRSYVVSDRETPDDGRFTETTRSSEFDETGSKVSENKRERRN